jgi:mRNA deadenylase 3'-5' endonuclease subunit Ccr4
MSLLMIIIELVECLNGKNSEHTFSFITGRENASTMFNLSSHDTQNTYDQGKAGSRDDMGEPLLTTYHHKFMGTVNYIWYKCSV